jgi:hypothetical protein
MFSKYRLAITITITIVVITVAFAATAYYFSSKPDPKSVENTISSNSSGTSSLIAKVKSNIKSVKYNEVSNTLNLYDSKDVLTKTHSNFVSEGQTLISKGGFIILANLYNKQGVNSLVFSLDESDLKKVLEIDEAVLAFKSHDDYIIIDKTSGLASTYSRIRNGQRNQLNVKDCNNIGYLSLEVYCFDYSGKSPIMIGEGSQLSKFDPPLTEVILGNMWSNNEKNEIYLVGLNYAEGDQKYTLITVLDATSKQKLRSIKLAGRHYNDILVLYDGSTIIQARNAKSLRKYDSFVLDGDQVKIIEESVDNRTVL